MSSNKDTLALLNKNLLAVVNLFPGHIYGKDLHGCYLFCNQAYALSLKLAQTDEIVGKSDYDFFSKALAKHIESSDLRVIKSATAIMLSENDSLVIKTPIIDENNQVLGLFGVVIYIGDITQHLEERIKTLDGIIAAMPWHIYWKDKKGILLGCNEQQAIDLGLKSRQEIVGKTDYDIISSSVDEETRKAIAKDIELVDREVMEQGQSKTMEEFIVRLDGTESTYLSKKTPMYDDKGKVTGLLGISVDITERKRLEEQLQKTSRLAEAANQLKTEFIQNMQHDIRTPISGIWSILDGMAQSKDLNTFAEVIPYTSKAAKELMDLCNEVIDFESIEYGEKPIYEHKFSIIDLVHSAVYLNGAAALAHKTSLEIDIADDVPDVVKGDDYRLKKILINLVSNAVKFTEGGLVRVGVMLMGHKDKQAILRFFVSDNGMGIPQDKLETIFEKFTKLTPSNTGKFKGTGLGLHIVKKFAAEMGAEVDVQSTLGEGTEFTVDVYLDLPIVGQLVKPDDPITKPARYMLLKFNSHKGTRQAQPETVVAVSAPTPQVTETTPITHHLSTASIALIEDDALACMAAKNILSSLTRTCDIRVATNVKEALHLLGQQRFDLVVSDLGLPDGSGFDIIDIIKHDETHINHQTPFVALTAHSDDEKREKAKKLGFAALTNKPLERPIAEGWLETYVPIQDMTQQYTKDVVDFEGCIKAASGNKQTALELLALLVNTYPNNKPLLEKALRDNDFTKARELLHLLRGGLSYMRLPIVESLAKDLHEQVKAREANHSSIYDLDEDLKSLYQALDDVKAWVNNNNP